MPPRYGSGSGPVYGGPVSDPAAREAPAGLPGLGRVPPVALVLTGVTSIQFGAALAATMFDDLGPSGTSLLRLAWAAAILLIVVRPDPRGHTRAELKLVALYGLVLGLMNLTFYLGLERLPLGVAVTVEFLGPLGVAVALSRRRADYAFTALAALGILLLADPGGDGVDPLGLLFVLIAAACWAAYILLAARAAQVFPPGRGVALAMCFAVLPTVLPGIAEAGSTLLEPELLVLGLGVALLSSVVPYSLELEALRRLPAHVFGVLMSLEPAVAALAGFLVLGEALGARELAAIACVIAATAGVTLRARGTPPPLEA